MTIPFQTINWSNIEKTEHKGETGTSFWQTIQFAGLRVRKVEYSSGYLADHWCQKGHIVHCLEGEFISELTTGAHFQLSKGMTYNVSNDLSSHCSISAKGPNFVNHRWWFLEIIRSMKNAWNFFLIKNKLYIYSIKIWKNNL